MEDEKRKKASDEDLENSFSDGKYREYRNEAQERWGKDMINRSENIVKNMDKEELEKIKAEGEEISRELADSMDKGAGSAEVHAIIERHFLLITQFYDSSWDLLEIYRGLGKMYVEDERFAANYTKYHPDLPIFMREAMGIFCDRKAE